LAFSPGIHAGGKSEGGRSKGDNSDDDDSEDGSEYSYDSDETGELESGR
jgi:hypothetical protein